mmetsp:Transcript_18294/g.50779  ORF Transcript_18294/g.50779 Transcript_18294/m.50779 type:complete len:94 (+) Transcript_18294:220-501(+)
MPTTTTTTMIRHWSRFIRTCHTGQVKLSVQPCPELRISFLSACEWKRALRHPSRAFENDLHSNQPLAHEYLYCSNCECSMIIRFTHPLHNNVS